MHSTKLLLGLALTALVANAQTSPAPPTESCVTCLTTSGKTLPACANVPIPYPFNTETLLKLTTEQKVCACALATSLNWTNACTNSCDEPNLTVLRTTLTAAKTLLCNSAGTNTTSPGQPTPTSDVKPPNSSAATTSAGLAASAVIVFIATAHFFL